MKNQPDDDTNNEQLKTNEENINEQDILDAFAVESTEINSILKMSDSSNKWAMVNQRYFALFKRHWLMEHRCSVLARQMDQVVSSRDSALVKIHEAAAENQRLLNSHKQLERENIQLRESQEKVMEIDLQEREKLSVDFDQRVTFLESMMASVKKSADDNMSDLIDTKDKLVSLNTENTFLKQSLRYIMNQFDVFQGLARTKLDAVETELELWKTKCERYHLQAHNESLKCAEMAKNGADLKLQLDAFVDKYHRIEEAFRQSHDLFVTLRQEMEQMASNYRTLQQVNATLKQQKQVSNPA